MFNPSIKFETTDTFLWMISPEPSHLVSRNGSDNVAQASRLSKNKIQSRRLYIVFGTILFAKEENCLRFHVDKTINNENQR